MEKKNEQVEIMRHSLSHVLAAAVKRLYPKTKFAIGPAIENGFYYDFDFEGEKIGEDELKKIEAEMEKIIKEDAPFEKSEMDAAEAVKKEKAAGQPYKAELIEDLKKEGEEIVSFYRLGDFEDLCRGPHLDSSGEIKIGVFKLDKVAGAYWRGDENREMLTRIYGLAFKSKEELEKYIKMMEEAEKRDHRRIGKELDLFSMHEEAPGIPFFHPKGAVVYNELRNFWIEAQKEFDYDMVICPTMLDVSIWKKSGHWDHYKDDMYFIKAEEGEREFALRPMDCPGAILVFNSSLKSYRELPLRYAEPGLITRKEKSGQLGGLMRVQQFVQDDAHLFLREDQIESEIKNVIKLVEKIYKPFGLEYRAFLSTRPDDYMGEIALWDQAENELKKILKEEYGDDWGIKEKDGAFYGPKIDFQLKDCIGRTWQCATIQLDFQMPIQFDCKFADKDGKEKTPVMIHRTIMGSFERFMGILIEHYAGAFPLWLAPVQIKVIAIGEKHKDYCLSLARELKLEHNLRAEVDDSDETVGNKIRKAIAEKVPYSVVIGDKEMESGRLAVRERGSDKTEEMTKDEFLKMAKEKVSARE